MSKKKANKPSGNPNIDIKTMTGDITFGDKVGGNKSEIGNVGAGANVIVGDGNVIDQSIKTFADWQARMNAEIDASPTLTPAEKQDAKEQVAKIESEGGKGEQADPGRLEKLINTLAVMAPDIFEVAVATLVNPLAGIGLVAKKISDKAKQVNVSPQT